MFSRRPDCLLFPPFCLPDSDDVIKPVRWVRNFFLRADRFVLDGKPGLVDGVRVTGNQRMPFGQIKAEIEQMVGTAFRHPLCMLMQVVWRKLDAFTHVLTTSWIVLAAAGFQVKKTAGNRRCMNLIGIGIDHFVQAASAAAITERLPLFKRHLCE